MNEAKLSVENITDPVRVARARAQIERGKRNADWLQTHWGDLLPAARGKFVAVAGQEAFIAATPELAWNWAKITHPEDDRALVQYVRKDTNPRIYGHRG